MALFDVTGAKPVSPAASTPTTSSPTPTTPASSVFKTTFPTTFAPISQPLNTGSLSIGNSGSLVNSAPPPSTGDLLTSSLARPTTSGGYVLHPSAIPSDIAKKAPAGYNANASLQTNGLETLPGGGSASFDQSGSPTGINSSPFSLGTGSVPSSALTSSTSPADLMSKRNVYADYAQQLYQATIPSSDYLGAVSNLQDAQQAGKQITANYYTKPIGDTVEYAQGTTARAQALNTLDQNAAANTLNVQQLIRQGNIDAYKALVSTSAPQTVSPGSSLVSPLTGQEQYSGLGGYQAVQGIQTVNNMIQQHPDAGVLPTDNPIVAAQKVNQSPSFQAGNLVAYATPGGGLSYINKLNFNQLQPNADGTYTLVTGGQAASGNAAAATIKDLTAQRAQVASAITTADQNFPLLLQAAKQAGVNNSSPLINQLQQKLGTRFSSSPAFAALQTLIPSLQTEYARIINRGGGAVTDSERATSAALVSGTYNMAQLQAVYTTVKAESSNVISGYDKEIQAQQAALTGGGSSTSHSSSSSSSSVGWY